MCGRIEYLGFVDVVITQNVLDVIFVTATSINNEKNTKSNEYDIKDLD